MALPFEATPEEIHARMGAGEALALIDVREPWEHQMMRIEGAELIPMNTIPQNLGHLEERAATTPLIIFCHHGMRSLNVVSWLRNQGIENCQSMSGGIDAWGNRVDNSVFRPR